MNADQRNTREDVISFKQDIKISEFKELEKAGHFRLFPPNPDGISSRGDLVTSHPSVECVVSPHGHEDEHYTHVSLHFKLLLWRPFSRVSWSAVVSILNVDGDPKFLRTLEDEETFMNVTNQDEGYLIPVPVLYCPEFVERRLLLNDEQENLPGGVLTIRCEMEIRYQLEEPEILKWALSERHLMFKTDKVHGYSCGLNLKSSIHPRLCGESTYSKDFLELFPSDDDWHYISDNLVAFADMLYFVENKKLDHVTNSSSLIRLYELANKYKVENLTHQCRKLMIETMRPGFVPKALLQAYICLDKELKDACFDYVNSLSEDERLFVKRELEAGNGERIIAELFSVD